MEAMFPLHMGCFGFWKNLGLGVWRPQEQSYVVDELEM